ncbi:ABC transporter ATP-binding protein [Janibacter cremeus]|uniref:ABC transporter ATP-binding protein n=1 Tax=Janibacter cremeus TaxID=1285192 RepID=UPI0023F900E1|nr:ABC transporter ATP-binding protein [Janibacter cremeus]WEV78123.1 ABC transporter ATP-binding protein [Janibacter cremeus]
MSTSGADLRIQGVEAGYGGSTVLTGVDLHVGAGETVALLGRNGVGKTTLMSTIMGFVQTLGGSIHVGDEDITRLPTHARARSGVAIVPQGRRVFAPLTVHNNLRIAEGKHSGDWTLERVYELMPRLRERRGNRGDQLSGGEQQMLAIGRALLLGPRVLLLDEPSDGLAPAIVQQVTGIVRELAGEGITVLIVEQDLRAAFTVADRVAVMEKGRIVHSSTVHEFRGDGERARRLLGVG